MEENPSSSETPVGIPPPTQLGPEYAEPALLRIREAVRGNGIKPEAALIHRIEGFIAEFDVDIELTLRIRTMEKIVVGKKSGGEKVEGPQGIRDGIEKERMRILSSAEITKKIKDIVFDRKDKGFGTRNEIIKLPFLTKEYVHFQPCRSCAAQGEIKCQRCTGRGYETCPRCNGQSMEVCSQCRGAQLIFNGNDKIPCPRCNGQGRTPCTMCNQTRRIPCNVCRTKGSTQCQNCNGLAWHSYITTAEWDVMATYIFDREKVPPKLVQIMESRAKEIPDFAEIIVIPTQTVAQAEGEQKSDEIPLRYHVRLPYAETEFALAKKASAHAFLLGWQAAIIDIPAFLEALIKPGAKSLQEAAEGRGSVATKINRAGQYRTVRQAIVAAAKYSKPKAARLLAKNTPLGISDATIKSLILNADRALKNITAKPRRNGVFAGTALAGLFYMAYLLTPLRGLATGMTPNEYLHIAIDGLVIGVGMILAVFTIQLFGAGAIRKALSKLLPPDQKNALVSKAGNSGLWSALLCVLAFLIAAEVSMHAAQAPQWYMAVRSQF